jgi:hypothetical protein
VLIDTLNHLLELSSKSGASFGCPISLLASKLGTYLVVCERRLVLFGSVDCGIVQAFEEVSSSKGILWRICERWIDIIFSQPKSRSVSWNNTLEHS